VAPRAHALRSLIGRKYFGIQSRVFISAASPCSLALFQLRERANSHAEARVPRLFLSTIPLDFSAEQSVHAA
jgi:hypothetical protein